MWFGTITKAIACLFLLDDYGVLSFAVDNSILNNHADNPVEFSPIYGHASNFLRPKRGIIKIRRINKVEGGDHSPSVRGMFEEEYQDGGNTKKSKVFYKSESGYSSSSSDAGMQEFNGRFPDFGFGDDTLFSDDDTVNNRRMSTPEDNFNMDFFRGFNNGFSPSRFNPYAQPAFRPYYQRRYIYPNYG